MLTDAPPEIEAVAVYPKRPEQAVRLRLHEGRKLKLRNLRAGG